MAKEKTILDVHEIKTETDKPKTTKPVFTKEQILSSKKYQHRKDVVNVLLKDDQSYTSDEVDKLIDDFMKRKVK